VETDLASKFRRLLPHLDERGRRLYLASEAEALGRGGITRVCSASGYAQATIQRGLKELGELPLPPDTVRRGGAGRKRIREDEPSLVEALHELVDGATRGDPMNPLRYTSKSTTKLAEELNKLGHTVSADTVGRILREEGFSLQANVKTREGKQHPDRDKQFKYINRQVKKHQKVGNPVLSVDGKKKELVGNFKNGGREWHPKRQAPKVNVHDFQDKELGKAIPYGIYDVNRNEGWVNVGCDHDTAAFAVETIRSWWNSIGHTAYPDADEILICADGGGSNGYRLRLWKLELARFAEETGLTVHVCHLPPGTSKWNKIEHRLFSHISMNWRGVPLTSHEVILNLIGSTTTKSGLKVHAMLDEAEYPTKIRVTDAEMETIPLKRHRFHGEWNYTVDPS